MSQDTHSEFDRILRIAMELSPEARAALAGSLLESLDETIDEGAEAAWELEVARRTQELDSATAKLVPWSKARRTIFGQ
jgi:hypothetical protein